MELRYIDGSPFARMVRVLIREHRLDVTLREIVEFPPSDDLLAVNPMGQVPVLTIGDRHWFPTRIVFDRLLETVPPGPSEVAWAVCRPAHAADDDQILAVILAMGDALALHHYLEWSGAGPVERNRLGFEVKDRAMVRVLTTLDWLEARLDPAGFQPGHVSVQDIALACLILWAESRGPIDWRGRPRIEALVDRLERRSSFAATAPRPHVLK